MQLTEDFNVIDAAADVVESQLGLLEALHDANKYRMDESSRLMCRCPSCRGDHAAMARQHTEVFLDVAGSSRP